MIKLDSIDFNETARYLGSGNQKINKRMTELFCECEKEISEAVKVSYLYKKVSLDECDLIAGESIRLHLQNCRFAVVLCVTVGAEVDKLIRYYQIADMAKAVVLDAMASVAVEQICEKLDSKISQEYGDFYTTWRFSPGYGDYPLEMQKKYLQILDAPRKIGLCTNDNYLLTPTKSVTAVIGLSESPIEKKRRNCGNCNLAKTCKYRKTGVRCDF